MSKQRWQLLCVVLIVAFFSLSGIIQAQLRVKGPGVRGGPAGAGKPFATLTGDELEMFNVGRDDFEEAEGVGEGSAPASTSWGARAAIASRPSAARARRSILCSRGRRSAFGAGNVVPSFIRPNGPIREARFQNNPDGSPRRRRARAVRDQRASTDRQRQRLQHRAGGLRDAGPQPQHHLPDSHAGVRRRADRNDQGQRASSPTCAANSPTKRSSASRGRLNRNGNDGTVSRFGWKAQNQSLLLFSGEAYNVEMGITNELFQSERDENPNCQFATVPNDTQLFDTRAGFPALITAIENFANFQRFLASAARRSRVRRRLVELDRPRPQKFSDIGCALCHTPSLTTRKSHGRGAERTEVANLYSDLALHNMGPGLADDVLQGVARGDEFRTAPLWGLGQRIFFLHDGRTSDLLEAIRRTKATATPSSDRRRRTGDRPVQSARRRRQAGPAEFPPLSLALDQGSGVIAIGETPVWPRTSWSDAPPCARCSRKPPRGARAAFSSPGEEELLGPGVARLRSGQSLPSVVGTFRNRAVPERPDHARQRLAASEPGQRAGRAVLLHPVRRPRLERRGGALPGRSARTAARSSMMCAARTGVSPIAITPDPWSSATASAGSSAGPACPARRGG